MFIYNVLMILAGIVFAGVSYLIWAKEKANAALLMLIGFGAMVLAWLIMLFVRFPGEWLWALSTLGFLVAAVGFFLTFQSRIQGQLDHLKSTAKEKLGASEE